MIDRAARPKIQKTLFFVVGLLFVGVGILGYILPLVPGTFFLILALCCFKRSSERFELWLLHNPLVGPTLQDWERNHSIKPRTKVVAIAFLWICIGISAYAVRTPWVVALLIAIASAVTVYLVTRRSAPVGIERA